MPARRFSGSYRAVAAKLYRPFALTVIYPSLWVAAGLASLVVFVQLTLGLNFAWPPVLLIFASASIFYNLDRIADSYVQEIPDRTAQAYFQQGWGWLVLISAAIATAFLLSKANDAVRFASLGGIVPLIYGLPLFPWRHDGNWRWLRLKSIPATKAWIVAGVIAYALIAVPLAYAEQPFTPAAGLTALFLLIFVGTNSHLFDIRDLESDRQAGVLTLPLLVGISGNRRIWLTLNGLMPLGIGYGWVHQLAVPSPNVVISCAIANCIALCAVRPDTPRALYDLVVDGYLFLPSAVVELTEITAR